MSKVIAESCFHCKNNYVIDTPEWKDAKNCYKRK